MLSFRFGESDGVSVEARKWAGALDTLGWDVRWIAGAGDALDVAIPGLSIDARVPPSDRDVADAIVGCDVVVVENVFSLPLNRGALDALARVLRGRPTIVHHHDLPWQRPQFASSPPPPTDGAWRHVTINEQSTRELARIGIEATTIYNRFARLEPVGAPLEHVAAVRPLVLQPTRALPRKNVPAAIALAEALDGAYWLLGPAEDGYGPVLAALFAEARCPVTHAPEIATPAGDAYERCDVVAFPSLWEGFGNPTIESALARRPAVVGRFPVANELRAFGFRWFDPDDADGVRAFLDAPDESLLDENERIAREHFALDDLPAALAAVLERVLP